MSFTLAACQSTSSSPLGDSDTGEGTDTGAVDGDSDSDTDTDTDTDADTDTDTDTNSAETALYVDVRNPNEYDTGHCVDALNIPLSELESRIEELGDKDRWIIVYCASGNRSRQAETLLDNNGFTNVEDGGAFSSLSCTKV
jgi:rhodanese-related sulfurtransferase